MTRQGKNTAAPVRCIITVSGVVQGVGFRPFIHRLAVERGLCGTVRNTSSGVVVDIEGLAPAVEGLPAAIREGAPPNSRITSLEIIPAAPAGYTHFAIGDSETSADGWQHVSPDSCTCSECLHELFDAADRRYRYPFVNCTNCGPRFTIIEDLPYDRPLTTMRRFEMCPDCQQEYENPADRRFHAEPNACPACGPRLWFAGERGAELDVGDPVEAAACRLGSGAIIALKGLGGFQLSCQAEDAQAVARLRQRKRRPHKPFAVMVRDVDAAARICLINDAERQLLESAERPIVLLQLRAAAALPGVAPGLDQLGIMLPCAPLHFLLADAAAGPLVMTSGNLSEEPICRTNSEALSSLSGIADYFLLHDRKIVSTYDDSVAMVAAGQPLLIRRARGFAPLPIRIGPVEDGDAAILATGAQLKNTFCLLRGGDAFVSQHMGDLEDAETLLHYERTIELYEKLFDVRPKLIAADLHPEYLASAYARERSRQPVPIQHHRAHIAACLADNQFSRTVIGVSFDGTGLGDDGAVWGGEFFLGNLSGDLVRTAHLAYVPLPGGDVAVKEPWRTALGAVWQHLPERFDQAARLMDIPAERSAALGRQLNAQLNCPPTSSCGRLFDAMAALILGITAVTYEAQAAMELESVARAYLTSGVVVEPLSFYLDVDRTPWTLSPAAAVASVLEGVQRGVPAGALAAGFHLGVCQSIVQTCGTIAEASGVGTVALSGGVFQNRLLLELVSSCLRDQGLDVLRHRQVPPNDGSISLGQAVLAHFLSKP